LEQLQNPIEKYNTVGTVPKSKRKIQHCRNSSKIQKKNTTLLEQFQNSIEKYNTVGTVPKSNRKIQHCWNSSKIQ
jgi:NADH:ubiquinone oxidoreductase subunit E